MPSAQVAKAHFVLEIRTFAIVLFLNTCRNHIYSIARRKG